MATYIIIVTLISSLFIICNIIFIKGLAIFKFFVALYSGFAMGVVALILAYFFEIRDINLFYLYFFIGFVIGFLLGWFLYKFFIYVAAAFIGFVVGALFGIASGGKEALWLLGILFAISFVYITIKFLNIYIILSITLPFIFLFYLLNGGLIFQFGDVNSSLFDKPVVILALKKLIFYFSQPGYQLQKISLLELPNKVLIRNRGIYLLELISFLSLAFFYQLYCEIKPQDLPFVKNRKIAYKTIIKHVMIISIIFYSLSWIQGYLGLDVPLVHYMTFFFMGWPLFILAIYLCLNMVFKNKFVINFVKKSLNYWTIIILVSVILIPFIYFIFTTPQFFKKYDTYYTSTISGKERVIGNVSISRTHTQGNSIKNPSLFTVPFYYAVSIYKNIFTANVYRFYQHDNSVSNTKVKSPFFIKIFQFLYYIILIPFCLSKAYKLLWEDS